MDDFYRTTYTSKKTGERTLQGICITCYNDRQKAYLDADPKRRALQRGRTIAAEGRRRVSDPSGFRRARRTAYLKNTYGITVDEWDRLLVAQSGRCAVCATALMGDVKPCLDHDHADQSVRGLLCPKCNRGLGDFNDDPERMLNAITYLWNSPRLQKVGVPREEVMPHGDG